MNDAVAQSLAVFRAIAHASHVVLGMDGHYFGKVWRNFEIETIRKRRIQLAHERAMRAQSEAQPSQPRTCCSNANRLRRLQFVINERRDLVALANVIVGCHRWKLNPVNTAKQKLLAHHFARTKQSILDGAERQAGYFDDLFVS